jgi:hypothetical protein
VRHRQVACSSPQRRDAEDRAGVTTGCRHPVQGGMMRHGQTQHATDRTPQRNRCSSAGPTPNRSA